MVQEVIAALVGALISVVVLVAGDRLRPAAWRQSSDEASGALALDVIKTFFTAVVAFIVVICWQQYQNAHNHTVTEAKGLVETYWAAHGMAEPDRDRVQGLVRDYTEQVVGPEWNTMSRNGRLSPAAQSMLDTLRDTVSQQHPVDQAGTDARSAAQAALVKVADARSDRGVDAAQGVPGFLYVALIFGTVLLLFSPVLSGNRVTWRSTLMTALLGVVIASALLQIHNFERPFSHTISVPRDAFEFALARYRHIG
ncbi:DUF4239 domain-containing protein [Nocardia sp. alder85J]|uniref:bestrophin-like domain n=1 Tax=Nocardia sp. alder85J TaxID=2862949 RepID=UPI001CD3D16C|nr:DUF4239 domain-containing protein [Nocardia sp. alder85J]MCX4097826.1 DUF4239 domain-containing protein [Nocardia sp. alder85J]